MANSSLGYTEPGSPNKRLFSRSFTEDAVTKDAQGIFICDASGNIVSVSSNRLVVDASGVPVPVTDNGGSLTVDGTVTADTELPAAATLADGTVNPSLSAVSVYPMLLEGGGFWYRQTGNVTGLLLSSAARTSTISSSDQYNSNARGVAVSLNVTAGTGFSLVVTIEAKDLTGSVYYALNGAPTPVLTSGLYVYEVYPGLGAASGGVTQRTSGVLSSSTWRATVTHGNANSATYSLRSFLTI